jgi:hypothetical protein
MQGARRKLSEPRTAGQRPVDWLCSDLKTSVGDSHLFDVITHVCADSHIIVKPKIAIEMVGNAQFHVKT